MAGGKRIFDNLAKVAEGAATALTGIKSEIETLARQRLERMLADMEVVPREEFDAVKAMAAKARTEQEKLSAKIARLEARIEAALAKRPRRAAKSKSKPKPKPKAGD